MAAAEDWRQLPLYDHGNYRILHPLTDTHCHLDYLKSESLEALLTLAKERGIHRMVTISVSASNHGLVLQLAERYDNIYCTQGIHPHQAKEVTPEVMQSIRSNLSHPKVLAVGEIGLDYHYEFSPREIQKKVFEEHLQLASDLGKPVVIHSRKADDDTRDILKNFSGKIKGVIHSFTSSQELATFALEQGLYLGFNGIITFKNAQNVRDVLLNTPLDRVLIETDSPYLAPIPWRGRENTPANIPWVAAYAMMLKSAEPKSFLSAVEDNANKLFKFPQ